MRRSKKTNREIEIKLRVTDPMAIQRKIVALGAIPQPRVLEINTLYDTPQSDFHRRDMLLRLRIETPAPRNQPAGTRERVILTTKAPPPTPPTKRSATKTRYKERSEREQVVKGNSREWAAALIALGFRPAFCYEKFRTTSRLPNLHLDLDETPAGAFLELEGSPEAIDGAASALGFAKKAYLRLTYWDIYVADCRRRRIHPKNMLFRAK